MIISASRRTDIPAFYSDWFINRLNSGYLYVKNPVNPLQVTKVILTPETVDCIVFWTKNPAPMLTKLESLCNYKYYFQFTITAFDSTIEKNLPSKNDIIETFLSLSSIIGPEKIIWRYDPVFFAPRFDQAEHLKIFENLSKRLSGHTKTCMFSFLTVYNKCKRNMQNISFSDPGQEQCIYFALKLASIAASHGITLKSCAMESTFSDAGIIKGRCVDPELVEKISCSRIDHRKDTAQRENCMCAPSIDIGAYNTCTNGCIYCYANYNNEQAAEHQKTHNPESELLYGSMTGNEKITVREDKCIFLNNPDQLKLF